MKSKLPSSPLTHHDTHCNSQGSVGAITAGTASVEYQVEDIVERYTYSMLGEPTIYDPNDVEMFYSEVGNKYKFQGRRFEPNTNLYYFRNRYYNFATGEFITPDPARTYGHGTGTTYEAFGGDGWNNEDAEGLDVISDTQSRLNARSQLEMAGQSNSCGGTSAPPKQADFSQSPGGCGPDVTDWLNQEIQHNSMLVERAFIGPPRSLSGGSQFSVWRKLVQTGGAWDHKLPILEMTARNKNCTRQGCEKTVTVCGMCVDYEVISNLHFGAVGKAAGFSEMTLKIGAGLAQISNHGLPFSSFFNGSWGDEPEDAAAIEMGFDVTNGISLCSAIKKRINETKGVPSFCGPCNKKDSPSVPRLPNVLLTTVFP